MMGIRYEYRINKKGAECFRTRDEDAAKEKLHELSEKRPGIYTMQTRYVKVNRFGVYDQNWKGEPNWSVWN